MISAFGIAAEPEQGILALSDDAVTGVHLTKLNRDGSAKAEANPNKIMIGKSSGYPIVLASPNDCLGLAVSEGIEDGLSIYQATGLGVWAAGSASRMAALAPRIPDYIEAITIAADADPAGQSNALRLAEALDAGGIEIFIEGLLP